MKYYVIINGESSLDIQGLVISKLPDISKPLMRNEKIEIDGRDGDIITKLGYSAYDKTIEIGLWGTYDINTIIEYFNQDGVITFSNEIDKYYNFSILNREDFINKLEKFKTASITLHCQPFKYEVNEETKEIENEYVERTGTSISLSNTLSAPMEIDLKGNTKQEQLSGKNLCDTSSISQSCITQGTDGYLLVSGVSSANGYAETGKKLSQLCPSLQVGDVAYLYLETDFYQDGWLKQIIYCSGNWRNGESKTITQQMLDATVVIYGGYQTTSHIRFMITKNSAATSYEQYCGGIPSPNPDYPQDVNVVSGNNNIVVRGKNKLNITDFTQTKNGITLTVVGNQIKLNGTATGYTEFYLTTTPYTISSGTYTFSINKISGTIENNSGNTTLYNTLRNNNNSNLQQIRIKEGAEVNTNTYSSEETISNLMISSSNGIKYTNYIYNLQLEQGNQATTYEPYKNQSYEINLGKNLLPFTNQDFTYKGIRFYCENGNLYFDGTSQGEISTNSADFKTNFSFYLDAGTYTFQDLNLASGNRAIKKYSDNSNLAYLGPNKRTETFTLTEKTQVYLGFYIYQLTFEDELIEVQLEKGNEATSYAPYFTPIELCKIGTYQDYFYKDSGKWYLHKETFNITLDGTESSWATAAAGWYSQSFTSIIKKSSPALSKQYTYTSSTWQGNYTFSINSSGFIAISDNRYTVRTDWINYLSNNNVDMLCVLDTPTNTEITDTTLIEQLEAIASATSYEGETNINQVNNDLPFIITASIFTGTDTITIENKGNTTAKPTMTIYGKGTIGVYLNGNQVFTINLGDEEYITIDTQNMEASKDTILKNRLVVGDYNSFVLQTGNNTLKFTGLVNKVEINNYSRWI